jgi:zinc protease
VAALLVAAGQLSAQTATATGRETSAASVASYALSADMPVDPEVLVGGLPNGLRYYIRPNPKPARQIELRLVVKAGSVLEDDDQRGLAHFVEHMQFQGSKHFPGQSTSASASAKTPTPRRASTTRSTRCVCRAIGRAPSTRR